MHLKTHYLDDTIQKIATRDGYGQALVELGRKDAGVVVLTADLSESTRSHFFQKEFPERFFEVGVAEQNLMGVAAGLALSGKIVFVSSYAVFSPGRNWDQLRVSVCYSQANVKIAGCHAGITVGPDGATHQALEDIAITRSLPNLVVLCPADAMEARKATLAAAQHNGPVYVRFSREPSPLFLSDDAPFEIGKAVKLREGRDVSIFATGPLVYEALIAAEKLSREHISVEVINNPSIKPLDEKTLLASARKTHAVITVEEHQVAGGFGSAVAEAFVQNYLVPMEMVGMPNRFGESGRAAELLEKYGMTHRHIIAAVKKVLARKHS